MACTGAGGALRAAAPPDNLLMRSGMDLFCRVFSNEIGPLKFARNPGPQSGGQGGPLKEMALRYALGLVWGHSLHCVRGVARPIRLVRAPGAPALTRAMEAIPDGIRKLRVPHQAYLPLGPGAEGVREVTSCPR